MNKLVLAFALLIGCASVLPVIRTVIDLAELLCQNAASEQPVEFLKGQTPQEFCKQEKNLQPFIDSLIKAKYDAKYQAGFPR